MFQERAEGDSDGEVDVVNSSLNASYMSIEVDFDSANENEDDSNATEEYPRRAKRPHHTPGK